MSPARLEAAATVIQHKISTSFWFKRFNKLKGQHPSTFSCIFNFYAPLTHLNGDGGRRCTCPTPTYTIYIRIQQCQWMMGDDWIDFGVARIAHATISGALVQSFAFIVFAICKDDEGDKHIYISARTHYYTTCRIAHWHCTLDIVVRGLNVELGFPCRSAYCVSAHKTRSISCHSDKWRFGKCCSQFRPPH